MGATPAEVARQLKAGFAAGPHDAPRVIGSLLADKVDYHHSPPLPSDGFVDGTRLAESTGKEAAAIARAISDQGYTDIEVAVDSAEVRVTANLRGILSTGAPVCLPTQMRCTVDDGKIVAITHVMDSDAMKAWAEVAAGGGLVAAHTLLNDSRVRVKEQENR
jgi:hypothetical protein